MHMHYVYQQDPAYSTIIVRTLASSSIFNIVLYDKYKSVNSARSSTCTIIAIVSLYAKPGVLYSVLGIVLVFRRSSAAHRAVLQLGRQ